MNVEDGFTLALWIFPSLPRTMLLIHDSKSVGGAAFIYVAPQWHGVGAPNLLP
jgi:hypothetical protein